MTAGARAHRTPVLRWQIQRLRHYQNAMAASRPHRASHPGPDHCPLLGRLYWYAAQTFTLYPKKQARSLTSFFKRGLRLLLKAALTLAPIPKLWLHAQAVGWCGLIEFCIDVRNDLVLV